MALEAARILDSREQRPVVVGVGDMFSPWFNTHKAGRRPALHRRLTNLLRRLRRSFERARFDRPTVGGEVPAQQRLVAVSHASSLARRAYRPHPYAGDLLVVSTAPRAQKFGETLGYDRHVTGLITTLEVAGGHSEMHRLQANPIGQGLRRYAV